MICELCSFLLTGRFATRCREVSSCIVGNLKSPADLSAILQRGANKTTLQDNAVEPASRSELISPLPVLLLAPGEPRAPIAILSPAKRNALVASCRKVLSLEAETAWKDFRLVDRDGVAGMCALGLT
jgi:hypothetical protein